MLRESLEFEAKPKGLTALNFRLSTLFVLSCAVLVQLPTAAWAIDAAQLYQQHCAACHGADRLGGTGPALLPENLKRLRKKHAAKVIANGRPASQMPAFSDQLSGQGIDALVGLIYTPLGAMPECRLPRSTGLRLARWQVPVRWGGLLAAVAGCTPLH